MKSPGRRNRSSNARLYRETFIRRVHQLLWLGYKCLSASQWAAAKEPDITGELVRCLDTVLDSPPPAISRWCNLFSVHPEPPFNQVGRLGKSRLCADIRIDSAEALPRARFVFEAKRLDKKHSERDYLGSDGLGAFLSGEYASDQSDVGMLGYVQSDTPQDWADKIAAEMAADPQRYCVRHRGQWRPHSLRGEDMEFAYESCHDRPMVGREVTVSHTLLVFC